MFKDFWSKPKTKEEKLERRIKQLERDVELLITALNLNGEAIKKIIEGLQKKW